MNISPTPQEQMDAAFGNYLALTEILRDDLSALLEYESDTQHWRRNFVRVSASLIEGHVNCLRELTAIIFNYVAPEISQREADALRSERSFDANERIKFTLRAAHKLFELYPSPNFGGPEWSRARQVFQKRHLLMHPKSPMDLEISDTRWVELREDVTWLIQQFFNVMVALRERDGG
jgi:hypothetical protein